MQIKSLELEENSPLPPSQETNGNVVPISQTPPSDHTTLAGAFERWITEYPNPIRVDTAAQSWLSLIDLGEITEATLPEVFSGLQRWKNSRSWADEDGRFVPAPSVFLTGNERHTGRMWKDQPPASAEAKATRKISKRSGDGIDPAAEWIPPWKEKPEAA